MSPASPARSWRNDLLDLLASMRFAISLLTVICIASAIGTVVKQGEPLVNYVDQFGPYWAEVFGALGLYRVYSTGWFLLILAFLVVSTSLCVVRNTPRILVDWRTHKEQVRASALKAFHHHAEGTLAEPLDAAQARVQQVLGQQGWSIKQDVRTGEGKHGEQGVMFGARLGAANKLGYIAAHSAIVLICLGGLFDGDLLINVQTWAQGLQPFKGQTEPPKGRLSEGNPAYRAQLFVPEGQRTDAAVVNLDKGMLVQPLPFEVELKQFKVEYYDTGMPKRFASDIVIHDARNKVSKPFTVEVNHPVVYDGVTIFQSSFEDGGSVVRLRPLALGATGPATEVVSTSVNGAAVRLPEAWWKAQGGQPVGGDLSLEVTGLRVINVENMAQAGRGAEAAAATDVRGVNLADLSKHLGSGAKPAGDKTLVNIGPSVTYKLRDPAGQAREYQNFMVPVQLDGQSVFLLGVRDTPAEGFRYLRVPADEELGIQGWLRLRQALGDAALRKQAALRFSRMAAPADRADLQSQLAISAQRAMDLFAGAVPIQAAADAVAAASSGAEAAQAGAAQPGGLQALSAFIEQVVPAADRERTSGTLIRILNGGLFELANLSRERAGLAPLKPDSEAAQRFMTQAVLSLSDAVFYPAPVVFALDGFEQKQASVFQVTRTPGRNVVYLGCVLLIIGVFAMLYIRERRLWVWLQAAPEGGTGLRMALSSTRQTLDTDREFEQLRQTLLGEAATAPTVASR
ncbi:cytochrome c biogenesis protein ResB [Aquabacterium sp.]|uniref:cytochrome c biogenesis protein ResB n=1 Tax=Aquabacterium sp. TaxID=1872578 RepID=UPI00345BE31B